MAKIVKKRNWAFVLYPESAPSNWREELQKTGLSIAISPLHDKDKDPTGEIKKSHYHIILCYSGPTSYNVVKSLTDNLGQPIPIPLEQVKGMYRYHIHLDNPEKYQYDDKERTFLNGFNILDFTELTKSEVHQYKIKIQGMIREHNLLEYGELMDFLLDNEFLTEHEIASNNTMFFDRYISSRRYAQIQLANKELEKKLKEDKNTVE